MILVLDSHLRSRAWLLALDKLAEEKSFKIIFVNVHHSEKLWCDGQSFKNVIIVDFRKEIGNIECFGNYENKVLDQNIINEIILSDRMLREQSGIYSIDQVHRYIRFFEGLACGYDISICFGEPTWAHEMVAFEVLRRNNVTCLEPSPNRFKKGEFLFYTGRSEETIFNVGGKNARTDAQSLANEAIENVRSDVTNYVNVLNGKSLKINFQFFLNSFRMARLAYFTKRNDFVHPNLFTAIVRKLSFISRKKTIYNFLKKNSVSDNALESFVFFPLHVTPERSIDALGTRQNNMLEMVRQIALNWNFRSIVLKEHPDWIGKRPKNFYEDFLKIPGVHFAAPDISSRSYMKKADFVYSVSGTALIEASILGVPAGSGAHLFFTKYLSHGQVFPFATLTQKNLSCQSDVNDLIVEMFENSFTGSVVDGFRDPSVVSSDNVELVKKAFSTVISIILERSKSVHHGKL